MLTDSELLTALHRNDQTDLLDDISNWLRYPDENSTSNMLADFDLQGTHLPHWVQQVGIMVINQDISITQFGKVTEFLSEKQLIQ